MAQGFALIARRLFCGALLVLAVPVAAYAAGAAPGLDGVREVIVQPVMLTDPKTADSCGISRDEITTAIVKELQADHVPAYLASEASPPIIGVARVDLTALIDTLNNQDLDCASWIEATVSSKSNVIVPPIDMPRSVMIQYWHLGTMIAGGQSQHERMVTETLQKMIRQFAKQYQLDQPSSTK